MVTIKFRGNWGSRGVSSGTVSDLEIKDVALTELEVDEGRALRRCLVLKELCLSPAPVVGVC